MGYRITDIAKIIDGQVLQQGEDVTVDHLLIDSRKLISAKGTLFFAIKGEHQDGHQYLEGLYKKGVRNFIISAEINPHSYPEATIIRVKNSVAALQQLAVKHRGQFAYPVIGVTGSNGKTIVKEWLYQLLQDDYDIVRSPKSFNSQVGVPLSVWAMSGQHNLGIIEAGISQPDEMGKLQKVVQPTIGIFTNIGTAHAEGFDNDLQKASEKLQLFNNCETLIYRSDYEVISEALLATEHPPKKVFTWSTERKADLNVTAINKGTTKTEIKAFIGTDSHHLTIPFTDDASIENLIHCWAMLIHLGCQSEIIQQRMLALAPIAMRLEMKQGINQCTIINDSYNSDINSLAIALDFMQQQAQHQQTTVILSDILQSGQHLEDLYKSIAQLLADKKVDHLIGIGKAIAEHANQFSNLDTVFYTDTASFIKQLSPNAFQRQTILIKGARQFGFERISSLLEQKAHETVLEINLTALQNNLNEYRRLLAPNVKLMAMVKAFSYGSGGYEVAKLLEFNRVDYLAVAYADEGVELREAGITLPIMVMNPESFSFEQIVQYQLEPELYSLSIVKRFIHHLQTHHSEAEGFPVHLKLETGMNRLGLEREDIPELIQTIKDSPGIMVQSVLSHFSVSEDHKEDNYSNVQINQFTELAEAITSQLDYPVIRHMANSAGIVRFLDAHFDMVRLGLGLYGIDITNSMGDRLQQVGRLTTTISQIKNVEPGESVGYGRGYKADASTKIATVGVGYADGIDRRLGNGVGKMMIKGKLVPIVGSVCMDMCMLDVSDLDVAEGDEVVVFGPELPVQQIAEWIETIPYEVMTNISQRVKRVFYQE